jgi:hypothetical protein
MTQPANLSGHPRVGRRERRAGGLRRILRKLFR